MASLTQSAEDLLLGLAGGDPEIQQQYIDGINGGASGIQPDGSTPFTADQSMGGHKLTNVEDPSSAQDAATKNYVDQNISALKSLGASQTIHVDPLSGNDATATGSLNAPFQTILAAQNSFSDEAISTPLGPQRNPAKSYIIQLVAGTYSEDPSWAPKQYVDYIGSGQDETFITHSDNSSIILHYGDNYGDGMTYVGINFNKLQIIRTPGFNDLSTQPNLWQFQFDDCALNGATVKGSGFDGGPFLAGGLPAFNADRINLSNCTAGGNVNMHAIQMNFTRSSLGNVIMDYVGSDGSVPYSGAYVNTTVNCNVNRMDLKNYIFMNMYNTKKGGFRFFGLNPDTVFNEIFGPNPFGFLDCDSTAGPFQFRTNAIPQQLQLANSLQNLSQNLNSSVVSGTYVSIADNNILADTSGASVDITLAPACNFGAQDVYDVKNNALVNNITVHPTSLDFMSENGSIVSSTTINTNGGHKRFIFTGDGGGGGSTQASDIQTVADVSGSLAGAYLHIYSITAASVGPGLPLQTIQFVPWFRVSGSGTAPVVADATIFPVDINTNDSADAVAAALLAVLQTSQLPNSPKFGPGEFADFEPGGLSNEITQNNFVNGAPPANTDGAVPTGFALSTTTPGAYDMNGTIWVVS